MKIKAKVVMLPTEKASHIHRGNLMNIYYTKTLDKSVVSSDFHLYLTTDEDIKVGDVCIYKSKYVVLIKEYDPSGYICSDNCKPLFHEVQKIVASTDESLGLPRPSNEFLKAYCEQGGIDQVLIEYTNHEQETGEFAHTDEELIPYIKVAPDNTITIHPVKQN